MGVNWSMEIISWFIDWQAGELPPAIWYLTDFCNALYGVFIFFIFVVKRTIWNLLKRRLVFFYFKFGTLMINGKMFRYYMVLGKLHMARDLRRASESRATNTTSLCGR